jgi:cell wall-associated protease
MKWILPLLVLGTFSARAASIAVIDSGLDYKHDMIVPNLWTNANETQDNRDNDGNGYQDDIHGWNFAEKNSAIIDYKYLGTFSPDCTKYFDIQGKYFLKQATEAEIAWMKEKQADKNFIKEMGKFGNFVHGTHVAGIAIRGSKNKAMGIKLIPTEINPFITFSNKEMTADRWDMLAQAFDALAAEQMKGLTEIAEFVNFHKQDVVNGSFGTGFKQAKMITDTAYKILFLKAPSAADSDKAAGIFMTALLKHGQNFVAAAPNTLFVFASGNDGMSNDAFGTSPANVKADNVITVGATYEDQFIAPFSNYGTKMVEVAAPGMLINSAIPGNAYLKVSGTSQASPYVANVAARVKESNPALKPVEIKKILMGTVDKKAFLADKITSGGIVNLGRAVTAAELTRSTSVSEAISRSLVQVKDVEYASASLDVSKKLITPIPLAPSFK